MVKKTFLAVTAALTLAMTGCGQLPSTARPNNASGLVLSVPAPEGVSAKFTLINPTLLYRMSSGADVISGSTPLSVVGGIAVTLNIDLPHDGQWLASAEWVVNGNPAYIGADLATVSGNTPFSLSLGTLNTNCYAVTMANPLSNCYNPDLFTFDSDMTAFSPVTLGPNPDLQAVLGGGATPSMVLQLYTPQPSFIYLGNGNWVDFTDIPAGASFYNDSVAAKRAILGATAVMAAGDVYAVKVSAMNTAWIQIQSVSNTGATCLQFLYRLNRHGFSYLKFDVTAYGDVNCNTSGVTLY